MTVRASIQNEQVLKVERRYYEQEQLNTELSYSKPENHRNIFFIFLHKPKRISFDG